MNNQEQNLDFAKVILRRKGLIAFFVMIALVVGTVFAFLAPKSYVVDTLIEIGTYPGFEGALVPIENAHQLTEKISSGSYDELVKEKLGIPASKVLGIKAVNPDNTNLVRVYIHSSRPEEALPVLREVGIFVVADHLELAEARGTNDVSGFVLTSIAKEPTIGVKPLNDKPVLILVFAAFVGGIFALLAAFGKEWWRRSLDS